MSKWSEVLFTLNKSTYHKALEHPYMFDKIIAIVKVSQESRGDQNNSFVLSIAKQILAIHIIKRDSEDALPFFSPLVMRPSTM